MSVEPSESMNEVWTRWQGHVINGTFQLGRFLGSSDHGGVYLTRSASFDASHLAIKLVPTNRAQAELLLPRWRRAGGLPHPHLLPLLQWGGCQLEGLPYLYAVMEYADQTLAQLLEQRCLTEVEAREMLPPALYALAFLHSQDLVQGQLKPSNVLVVGDQLKLASDTVRRVGEGTISTHGPTVYDPPEGRQGSTSPAGDIWALGITLCEALTRRRPLGLGESAEAVTLPADFPEGFRDIVARCLSPRPADRPSVAELVAWAGGASLPEASKPVEVEFELPPTPGAAPQEPAPAAEALQVGSEPAPELEPAASHETSLAEPIPELAPVHEPVPAPPPPPATAPATPYWQRPRILVALGAALIVLLVWVAVRALSGRPAAPPPPAVKLEQSGPQAPATQTPPKVNPLPARSDAPAVPTAVHEVMPEIPAGARRTVRGHIKVWVRVVVEQDGTVFAAIPDRAGPSRYFERLAVEAARKWTFPPADSPARRILQVRFDISREGVTGQAVTLR